MRLILVRHAQTIQNAAGINQGWRHGRLSPLGKEQAKKLAQRLAKERIDVIYVSDLRRVQQTLAPLRKLRPEIRIITTPKLREENLGIFEGTKYGSVQAAAEKTGLPHGSWQLPGGESIRQLEQRVDTFTDKIVAKYGKTDKTVCFYTHGGPIGAISMHLLGVQNDRFRDWHPHNACHHIFVIKGTKARCIKKHVAP